MTPNQLPLPVDGRVAPRGHAFIPGGAAVLLAAFLPEIAAAQVVSVQPTSGLGGSDFAASLRMQYGASVPPDYQVGVVGNVGLNPGFSAQITSALEAVITSVTGQAGLATGTSPSVWDSLTGTATFTIQFVATGPGGQGDLVIVVDGPGFTIPVVIADQVNFASAQGVNLNFLGGGGAFFGGLVLTSGAGPGTPIGPSGNWSGTVLDNSTLTGWDFTQDWTLEGSMRFFTGGGSAVPRLQFDILNQGLAYQLSDQGPGRPGIVNYGYIQDLVITEAEFQQAQFGGTNGLVEADVFSRAAVTFDIAAGSEVELSGGLFDLTAAISFVEPGDYGTADFVKDGDGTLTLSGTSDYSGTMRLNAGRVILQDASGIGAGGLEIGNARLTLDTAVNFSAALPITVLGDATIDSDAPRAIDLSSTIDGGAATSLTLRRLEVDFDGDATAFLGELALDDSTFTMSGEQLGGSVLAQNGSVFDATGTVDGGVELVASRLMLTGGDATVPGELAVTGDFAMDGDSTLFANVFLAADPLLGPTFRQSDRVSVSGNTAMGGALTAFFNRDLAPGRLVPNRGESRTWQIIDASAGAGTGSGAFTLAQLQIFDPSSGTSSTIDLPINGSVDTAVVRYSTTFDATGAYITLTGLAAVDPASTVQTSCGTYSGAEVNEMVDRLVEIETLGNADASAIAGAILLQDIETIPPSYAATQQRNPYADPDVILDSNAMAGRLAMLRLMQLRDGALGSAAAKAADASGGRAPEVAAQSAAARGPGAPLNGPTPDEDARPWMRGYGFYEDIDGDDCTDCGYDASIGALMAGADWAIDGGGILGGFIGLGPGAISYDVDFGSQNENVLQAFAGIFGSVVPGDGELYLQGFVMGGYYDFDRTRTISLPDVSTRVAESGNDAWSISAGGELGLNLEVAERTWLQPFAGVTWGQYWGDGYSETGADSLNLTVQDQSANQWMPTAGARLMHSMVSGRDLISPYIGAAFLGQVPVGGGWAPVYTSDFNLGEATQAGDGPPDRYGVTFQAGIELARITGVTLYAAFDGAVLTGKQRFGGQFGVVVPF